jgi:quinol monooxygenase YgiN
MPDLTRGALSLVYGVTWALEGVSESANMGNFAPVPDPIVFISHSKIKEGGLDAFRQLSREIFPLMEAEKPGTVLHYGYVNEEETEIHFVHVFPDAAAMDAHMVGADERTGKADEFIDTFAFEIYGTPSEETLTMLQKAPGVDVAVNPAGFGGYLRLGK